MVLKELGKFDSGEYFYTPKDAIVTDSINVLSAEVPTLKLDLIEYRSKKTQDIHDNSREFFVFFDSVKTRYSWENTTKTFIKN